jgi:MSHA biogenesis protein MshQ
VQAQTCGNVFSAGAQAHSASGVLDMGFNSRVLNGGTSLKVPQIIDNSGGNSCGTGKCTATGTFNSPVNYAIPATNGSNGAINVAQQTTASRGAGQYTTVNVQQDATLTFSASGGKYYMSSLISGFNSKINFAPGDYYINGNMTIGNQNSISITGSQPVRIFVNGQVTVGFQVPFNNSNPGNLLIYAKNSITLDQNVKYPGYLYSQTGDITIKFLSEVTGGVSAAGRITLSESKITYSNAANSADFGALCSTAPSINNFNINVGTGAASTCSDFLVTITARDSSNNPLTGYTGTITLTTSTNRGIWRKTGVASAAYGNLTASNTDNGQATYTFTTQDAGDITLLLDNQHAQSLTVRVVDGGVGTTSGTVTFSANAFVIESTDSLSNDVIAGRSHSFVAKMMTQDLSSPTKACRVASFYNNTNVKMWLLRDTVDPLGMALVIKKDAQTLSPPNSEPAVNNINLAFKSGEANFTLLASDVGKYRIAIADTSKSFSSSDIRGQSAMLTARPFGIRVSVSGNPAATDGSGSKFRAAGQAFTLTVTAVAWEATDDQNNDGIPDGHDDNSPLNNANLSNNTALVSFGKEKPTKGITASAFLVAPSGGNNPGLSGATFSDFTVGTASSALVSFGEVGIIEISASVTGGDYLGSPGSANIIGKSGHVGRFIPDHFRLSGLALTPACNAGLAYSYTGENFSLAATMTPYGANGAALKNYIDSFKKFNENAAASMFYAADMTSSSNLTSRLVSPSPTTVYSWSNGVLSATPSFNIKRLANPDGPFAQVKMGFKPVDADGVTLRSADLNLDINNDGVMDAATVGNPFRLFYGRLRLDDSYGPETANLPVIFRTEYWDGSEWRQNRDDSCTRIAATKIRYPGGPINVVANRSATIGAGSTTGVYANLDATAVNFTAGDAGHHFTAPGAGNTGSLTVQVDLSDYPWLQFDWNGDGNYNDANLPDARFSFGNYRGHDRVLYWIESTQH